MPKEPKTVPTTTPGTSSATSPATSPDASPETSLPGRRGQAARNDTAILDAARQVFLWDAKAPVAAVAERAGVGISALYRRYAGKEGLLRRLCHDGLRRFIAEAEAAGGDPDAWSALTGFIQRVVDADVHSLTVHLAGTFTPTEEMGHDAQRANALAAGLVDRAHAAGRLRRDVVADDIGLVLEACAAIRVPDPTRTAELRRRHLALMLPGLADQADAPLPGPAPRAEELNWRWRQ
jgi:AcrR family transcriptional regulator